MEVPDNMTTKKLTRSQLTKFRSDVAKLKAKGLVSARVDARKQKPTYYMRKQVENFGDVLSGKARVVHTPKAKDAKEFAGAFKTKGKSVVVPVEKGERVRYSKKSKEIIGTREAYGRKIKKTYSTKRIDSAADLPSGDDNIYSIPIGNAIQSFDTKDDLIAFMFKYEQDARNPYRDWARYVIIEQAA